MASTTDSGEHDSEAQPLLAEHKHHDADFIALESAHLVRSCDMHNDPFRCATPREETVEYGIHDVMQYKTFPLTTWHTFSIKYAAVWRNHHLWVMMGKLSALALIISLVTILVVPNPAAMKVGKFTDISKFLNVVVGLLLGFFLSSSMQRWHSCVQGFMSLGDAVRNVQIQFVALGVPEDVTVQVLRYAYSSAWLLWYGLLMDSERLTNPEAKDDWVWKKMAQRKAIIDSTGKTFLLTGKEIKTLRTMRDPPYIVWTWIAVLLGRLARRLDSTDELADLWSDHEPLPVRPYWAARGCGGN
jgi:hypothetical protein